MANVEEIHFPQYVVCQEIKTHNILWYQSPLQRGHIKLPFWEFNI